MRQGPRLGCAVQPRPSVEALRRSPSDRPKQMRGDLVGVTAQRLTRVPSLGPGRRALLSLCQAPTLDLISIPSPKAAA